MTFLSFKYYLIIIILIHRNGYTCNDINECTREQDACQQQCQNTDGSYICSCNTGYALDPDGLTCSGEFDIICFVTKEMIEIKLL